MASFGEPPSKRLTIDFTLCLKCQREKHFKQLKSHVAQVNSLEPLVGESELPVYEKFLESVNQRALYGNQEYVNLNQCIHNMSAEDLKHNKASWQRTCCSQTTHKQHTDRDKTRYEKAVAEKEFSILLPSRTVGRPQSSVLQSMASCSPTLSTTKVTRSHVNSYNRSLCFYCQDIKYDSKNKQEDVHECRSPDIGKPIQKIVETSNNDMWKVYLADFIVERDFLSRDIKYHKSCHTTHWRNYVQGPTRIGKNKDFIDIHTVEFISAEIEYFAELEEQLGSGEFLTVRETTELYNRMMLDHGFEDQFISLQEAINKIKSNIRSIVVTPACGRNPSVISSTSACRSAIDDAKQARDVEADMKVIFQCSKLIRQSIMLLRQNDHCCFDGSLNNNGQTGIPPELSNLMRWILQGAKAAATETRTKQLHLSCTILSHSIMQECKTTRQLTFVPSTVEAAFRQIVENPYAVGLSLYMYHNFRSQDAVSMLSRCGVGISYERVTKICNNILHAIAENIREYGLYVPPGLVKCRRIRASLDNIDKNVDTPDGKGSFHGTALGVYQSSGPGEAIVNHVQFCSQNSMGLVDIPAFVTELVTCKIEGNPKPKNSPHYPAYKIGRYDFEYIQAQDNDLAWMLARWCCRSMPPSQATGNHGASDAQTSRMSTNINQ